MNPRAVITLTIVFLLVAPSAVSLARPFRDRELDEKIAERGDVIDVLLSEKLLSADPDDQLGIVVQFRDGPSPADLDFMDAVGLSVHRKFRSISGAYATGPKEGVVRLAEWDRTVWIEYNEKMVLLMNGTTTVVNATKVWNTAPMETTGRLGQPIDGTGVTVAVVDTGIDAGHPDLDYKEKVIINLKSDLDGTFTEVEDGDTGSGHGTHCAGTIGGNGDASASARRGVAPGAKIIGISTGEHWLQNVVGALQWVYDHSQPSNNPYNIRVVSNSWGSGAGEYNPQDSVTIIAQKMVYENNVNVVFAAGNSGGTGTDIQTSTYGNTPAIIEVAAALHDGNGLATFSSRGKSDLNQTWSDIAAPGYHIWATQARKTQITAMVGVLNPDDGKDAYYMSISGTSMATPHVSGAIALLWQACPHLGITNISENSMNTNASYFEDPLTKISEAEWILEATATRMPFGDAGIPENYSVSTTHFDHPYDFAQGYGLINMEKAVQVALVLEELRRVDPEATVFQAYKVVMKNPVWTDALAHTINMTMKTDTIQTTWTGEWGYLLDERNSLVTHHERSVFIPNGTKTAIIDLNYNPSRSVDWAIGMLQVQVDSNQDGSIDWSGQGGFSSHGFKHDEVDVATIGSPGSVWDFYVTGTYLQIPGKQRPNTLNNQYVEILVEYTLGVKLVLETSEDNTTFIPPVDIHASYAQWEFGDPTGTSNGTITMERFVYNYSRIVLEAPPPPPKKENMEIPWWLIGLVIFFAVASVVVYLLKRMGIYIPFYLFRNRPHAGFHRIKGK